MLIFTLALISCAGTKYIHSISSAEAVKAVEAVETLVYEVDNDLLENDNQEVVMIQTALDVMGKFHLI